MLHMCSLLNYGFVNDVGTCVFYIVFVLFCIHKTGCCNFLLIKVLNFESLGDLFCDSTANTQTTFDRDHDI